MYKQLWRSVSAIKLIYLNRNYLKYIYFRTQFLNYFWNKMAKLQFTFYAIGIFVSFFCYGIIHEKITKTQYTNPDGSVESFTYSTSLVTIYCIMNYFFSLIISSKVKQEDTTPTILYVITAFLYFLAMVCSNLALQFINYPTQVIAKSCKPITVMIFGVLLGRKSYSFKKYIFVGMVVVGVIMFLHKEKQDKKSDGDSSKFWIKLIFCFFFKVVHYLTKISF